MTRSHRVCPNPDPRVPTELALASDGSLYIALAGNSGEEIVGRPVFVGYALNPREVALLGHKLLLRWALIETLAIGTDGRIYVNAAAMQYTDGRPEFRGYKASDVELAGIVERLHATVFNLTFGLPGV